MGACSAKAALSATDAVDVRAHAVAELSGAHQAQLEQLRLENDKLRAEKDAAALESANAAQEAAQAIQSLRAKCDGMQRREDQRAKEGMASPSSTPAVRPDPNVPDSTPNVPDSTLTETLAEASHRMSRALTTIFTYKASEARHDAPRAELPPISELAPPATEAPPQAHPAAPLALSAVGSKEGLLERRDSLVGEDDTCGGDAGGLARLDPANDDKTSAKARRKSSVAVEVASDDGTGPYTGFSALQQLLQSGDMALVRASYLLELAATPGGRFTRRQDLPAHALVDESMLACLFAELRAWRAFVKLPTAGGGVATGVMRFPPFVVTSYAWSDSKHPDPDGRQLREVLAPALEWYLSERAAMTRTSVLNNWGGAPIPTLEAEPSHAGIDFGVFVDYMSLHQSPRDAAQDTAFRRALGAMDVPYAHESTCVMRLTRVLDGQSHLPCERCGRVHILTNSPQSPCARARACGFARCRRTLRMVS